MWSKSNLSTLLINRHVDTAVYAGCVHISTMLEDIMRVACVPRHDHSDISKFSGSLYYQAKCLADSGLDLDYVSRFSSAWESVFLAKTALHRKILRQSYARHYQPTILRSYARQIEDRLDLLMIVLDRVLDVCPAGRKLRAQITQETKQCSTTV